MREAAVRALHATRLFGPARAARAALERRRRLRRGQRLYAQFISPGDLVFDVGAFMGERTELLLATGARVVCVEPQPACAAHLRATLGLRPDVVVVEAAVGATEGEAELAIAEMKPALSTLSAKWQREGRFARVHAWTQRRAVRLTTLEALRTAHGEPAFCKIDVEGSETEVLRGCRRPLRALAYEFTREFLDDAVTCAAMLQSLGPVTFNCSVGESFVFMFRRWVSRDELFLRLQQHDDPTLWGEIYARSDNGAH